MQFSSPKYSGVHETDTIHLFILMIRQMKQYSSDAVETWCYFHFHLFEYIAFCAQRGMGS